MELWTILVTLPDDGVTTAVGPFSSWHAAQAYALADCFDLSPVVVPLSAPLEPGQ